MRYLLLTIALTCLLFACKQTGIEIPGYTVVKHKEGSGKASFPGSHVLFELDSYDSKGNLLQSMRGGPVTPQVQIPEEEGGQYVVFVDLLSQVNAGDSLSLFIPYDSIPQAPAHLAGTDIEYRMAITDVLNEEEYAAHYKAEEDKIKAIEAKAVAFSQEMHAETQKQWEKFQKGGQNIVTSTNGIKIMMIEEGRGDNAAEGKQVTVDYVGMMKDGTVFDDSYKRGQPFSFGVGTGQVIKGWDEGVQYLNVGSRALLEIPSKLAYGERGAPPNIPGNTDLLFMISVNAIN